MWRFDCEGEKQDGRCGYVVCAVNTAQSSPSCSGRGYVHGNDSRDVTTTVRWAIDDSEPMVDDKSPLHSLTQAANLNE
jgi:hypothetical protein